MIFLEFLNYPRHVLFIYCFDKDYYHSKLKEAAKGFVKNIPQ